MRYLRVKNWADFQHYKDRNPPWIKLHRALLDDYEFAALPDVSKGHLVLIWLFASQNDGRIPEDAKFLQAKLSLKGLPDLEMLIIKGFLIPEQNASVMLAPCEQGAGDLLDLARSREERREEERRDGDDGSRHFDSFWALYPRKVAKQDAAKAWAKLKLKNGDFERVLAALAVAKQSDQWSKDNGRFIPHASTWLNGKRFEDDHHAGAGSRADDPCAGAV